jgi:hypothetical protein
MGKARKYKERPKTDTNPLQRDEAHIKAREKDFACRRESEKCKHK